MPSNEIVAQVPISEVIRNRIKEADVKKFADLETKLGEAKQKVEAITKNGSAEGQVSNIQWSLEKAKKSPAYVKAYKEMHNLEQALRKKSTFYAADNIAEHIEEGELDLLQDELAEKFQGVLESLIIDTDNDHNTNETAKRVAKMYLREVFAGRYEQKPKITEFPNIKEHDEIIVVGPITVRSACSHHFVPIMGSCWIGIKPGKDVAGLSKYGRLANWIMSRPHIQEEMVEMVADELEALIKPEGLIVVIGAAHMCMTWRGVKEKDIGTTTSVVRGRFLQDKSLKQEFFNLVEFQKKELG